MPEVVDSDARRINEVVTGDWKGPAGLRVALQRLAADVRREQRESDAALAETVSLPAAELIRHVAKR